MNSNIFLHPIVCRSPVLIDHLQRSTDTIAIINDDMDVVLVDAETHFSMSGINKREVNSEQP